jgi:hypothetical protein
LVGEGRSEFRPPVFLRGRLVMFLIEHDTA